MTATTPLSIAPVALPGHVGTEIGHSGWREITQERIALFADATDDHQWIHVDAEQAARGPYGRPIAHGFLVLSLLSALVGEVLDVTGRPTGINFRVDRVRFRAPVAAGDRVRARVTLQSVRTRPRDYLEVVVAVVVELEDGRVACTAEQTTLYPGAG